MYLLKGLEAPSPLAPPDDPDPPPQGGEVVEEPRIPLNSVALRVHQAHGHAPFDRNCASCVSWEEPSQEAAKGGSNDWPRLYVFW